LIYSCKIFKRKVKTNEKEKTAKSFMVSILKNKEIIKRKWKLRLGGF